MTSKDRELDKPMHKAELLAHPPHEETRSLKEQWVSRIKYVHPQMAFPEHEAGKILALLPSAPANTPELVEWAERHGFVLLNRKEFLCLPIEKRRRIISRQVTIMLDNIPDEQKLKEMHEMMD